MKEFRHSRQPIRPDGRLSRAIGEMNAEFRRVLKKQLRKRGRTLASVSAALGHSRAWLQRLLAGTRSLREEHLNDILEELEMSLEELFVDYLQEVASPIPAIKSDEEQNPVLLLRALRGRNDPDLEWVGSLAGISAAPLPRDARFPLHPSVRRIDDLREFDRQSAMVEAESWLRRLQKRAEHRRLQPEETSQLSTALGVWSSIQRVLGRLALGTKALELAWQIHGEAPTAPSCGDLLQRSSMTIRDYGFPSAGYPLMQRAYGIAAFNGDLHRESKALLGLGILAFEGGDLSLALDAYGQVIGHAGADLCRRTTAARNKAIILEQAGELQEAIAILDTMVPLLSEVAPRAQHQFFGIQARILRKSGDLKKARAIYERLLTTARPLLSPLDCTSVLLHLFEVLIAQGDPGQMREYSTYLAGLVEELEDTPLAREMLRGVLAAVRQGDELTSADIEAAKSALLGSPD